MVAVVCGGGGMGWGGGDPLQAEATAAGSIRRDGTPASLPSAERSRWLPHHLHHHHHLLHHLGRVDLWRSLAESRCTKVFDALGGDDLTPLHILGRLGEAGGGFGLALREEPLHLCDRAGKRFGLHGQVGRALARDRQSKRRKKRRGGGEPRSRRKDRPRPLNNDAKYCAFDRSTNLVTADFLEDLDLPTEPVVVLRRAVELEGVGAGPPNYKRVT